MSQEMNILCCYACEMFQVHIVKKAKKWQCKVCNAKQSIRRVYFQGSGKDCRSHVQQLNSQKQKGFESVGATHSNTDGTNNISHDIKDSLCDQQMSDIWLNKSKVIFDNVNIEYTRNEQIIDNNHEGSRSNLSNDSTYESEPFDCINNKTEEYRFISSQSTCEIEESRFINSKSTSYISDNTETESASNDVKENHNIFESYEDFDVDLDF